MSVLSRWSKAGVLIKAACVVVLLGAPAAALAGRVVGQHQHPQSPVAVAPSPTAVASPAATQSAVPEISPTPAIFRPTPLQPTRAATAAVPTFDFSCPTANEAENRCTVTSRNGFSASVTISCRGNYPTLANCEVDQNPLRPPPNGRATAIVSGKANLPPGVWHWEIVAQGGGITRSTSFDYDLRPVLHPSFSFACSGDRMTLVPGGSAMVPCTLHAANGFRSVVRLGCDDLPVHSGLTCSFSPAFVQPLADADYEFTLTVHADFTAGPRGSSVGVDGWTVDGRNASAAMVNFAMPAPMPSP